MYYAASNTPKETNDNRTSKEDNTMQIIPYIVKWEGGKNGNPILFFPTYDVNRGEIACYAHMGQHSEACLTYYWGLRNPTAAQEPLVAALVREYQGIIATGEELKRIKRDSSNYRAFREA
jgi:hypothetical protein